MNRPELGKEDTIGQNVQQMIFKRNRIESGHGNDVVNPGFIT